MTHTCLISHFNGARCADELVVYTGDGKTGTNAYGWEACVKDGRVVRCGRNNNDIPNGGFVLSGHGNAAAFLAEHIMQGAAVQIDEKQMQLTITVDHEAMVLKAQAGIEKIEKRLAERVAENCIFDRAGAEMLLQQAKDALQKDDFADVDRLTEEAYYLTAASVKGETRGIWHRPTEKSEEQVEKTVLRLMDAGFNLLLVETNYEGYANALRCRHDYLPLQIGASEDFDVIDAFIRVCKKHGMQIHAWFEDFFFGTTVHGCPMAKLHPEWMARRKDGSLLHDAFDDFYFLNPVLPEVQELLLSMCRELLEQYDFDGLQLDYIRYPVSKGIDRSAGFEDRTVQMFLQETGIDIRTITDDESDECKRFIRWRAAHITAYVGKVRELIDSFAEKGRKLVLSTAVFGDPDEAIRLKCQDWQCWVKKGWLDAIYPMAYLNDAEDVGAEVRYMVEQYGEAPNISGISPMYGGLPVIESTKQVEECRKAGAVGVAFFAAHSCTDVQLEKLRIGVFRDR